MTETFKLRLVTWSVVGLAALQLFVGRYAIYPFVHWTMFAFVESADRKQTVSRTVVVAVDRQQQSHVLRLNKVFGAVPGSNGAAKSVTKRYLRRLRRGDQEAATDLARSAQNRLGIPGIVMVRLETWTWDVDTPSLEGETSPASAGKPDRKKGPGQPDRVKEIVALAVAPN